MPTYHNEKFERIKDNEKDIFKSERLEYDLSGMRFLHSGVDTIRQLFNCDLKASVFNSIEKHYEHKTSDVIELGEIEWKITSSGKKSGYQYIFKNLDIGFVVLFKSFYCEASERGAHLKIEATPQVIAELGLVKVSNRIREIASIFGDTLEASGVAVHMAVDMKGVEIPEDFERRLVCRAKRSFKVHGISDASNSTVSTTAVTYGHGETYLFGSSSALQMCLYDKSKEALSSGKLEYWESIWKRVPSLERWPECEYNEGQNGLEPDQVTRLEFRIHHSVIRQFVNGNFNETGNHKDIREAKDLVGHLDSLWAYCLNNFRLQHSDRYIHPIWQKIQEDVQFVVQERWDDGFVYKRSPKCSSGAPRRNVAMWLGNALRLAARRGLTTDYVVNWLLQSGLDAELADYFDLPWSERNNLGVVLGDFVENRLRDHRLNGVAV